MTYIIAEIGNNHEGSPERAMALVAGAINAEVNAVKFQIFEPSTLVAPNVPALVGEGTQLERLKQLQLEIYVYEQLANLCHYHGVDVIVSPFSLNIAEQCAEFTDKFKVASGEITNYALLKKLNEIGKPVIMSTGMATMEEIILAAEYFQVENLSIMHCVSLYHCSLFNANLSRIKTLKQLFPNHTIGYSDHCIGTKAIPMAVLLGAEIIEKHFTATPDLPGDHVHSITKSEMITLKKELKIIQRMVNGNEEADFKMRNVLRRSGKHNLRGGLDWEKTLEV